MVKDLGILRLDWVLAICSVDPADTSIRYFRVYLSYLHVLLLLHDELFCSSFCISFKLMSFLLIQYFLKVKYLICY